MYPIGLDKREGMQSFYQDFSLCLNHVWQALGTLSHYLYRIIEKIGSFIYMLFCCYPCVYSTIDGSGTLVDNSLSNNTDTNEIDFSNEDKPISFAESYLLTNGGVLPMVFLDEFAQVREDFYKLDIELLLTHNEKVIPLFQKAIDTFVNSLKMQPDSTEALKGICSLALLNYLETDSVKSFLLFDSTIKSVDPTFINDEEFRMAVKEIREMVMVGSGKSYQGKYKQFFDDLFKKIDLVFDANKEFFFFFLIEAYRRFAQEKRLPEEVFV